MSIPETRHLLRGGCPAIIGLALFLVGCGQTPQGQTPQVVSSPKKPDEPAAKPDTKPVALPSTTPAIVEPVPTTEAPAGPSPIVAASYEEPLPPAELAEVKLTAGHAALCKVKVGDTLPALKLPDLAGKSTELASLFGKKGTVVLFFTSRVAFARMELADLTPDVAAPFAARGIQVIAIAVGHTAADAQKSMKSARASFPCLVDENGEAFAQVGSDRMPRTFLLDSAGKIIWFDLEYSRTTRRQLRSAVACLLTDPPQFD